jgi:hypothetical protein
VEIRRKGGAATDRLLPTCTRRRVFYSEVPLAPESGENVKPNFLPGRKGRVIFIRSERFVPQGNLLAPRSLKSVCDERGGSYLTVTALETPPLFGRTNLHPLFSRLARRNSRTSLIRAKNFPFRTRERFPQRVVGGNAWVCADYSIWCDQEFFKT